MQSPLMYAEYGLIKYAARFASSLGSPKRSSGIRFFASSSIDASGISAFHAPSVGKGPGAIAFARILYAVPHSTASERVIANTPALAITEGNTNADPVQ